MVFTVPAAASVIGRAQRVRFVHLPFLPATYHCWSFQKDGVDRIAIRPFPGVDFDEVIVSPFPQTIIKNFFVVETAETPNHVYFLWDDGQNVWRLEWDVVGEQVATEGAIIHEGTHPTAGNDGILKQLYQRSFDLRVRELNDQGVPQAEQTLVRASQNLIRDHDITVVNPEDIGLNPEDIEGQGLLYVGRHSLDISRALNLLKEDLGTELLIRAEAGTIQVSGLPANAQHWWKFDEASGNLIPQLGGVNGVQTGGTIGALAGKVNGARSFPGTPYFHLGNPASLQHAGDQFLAMWLRPAAGWETQRRNPWAKSYSSEGTWTVEQNGSVNAFYGNNPTANSGGFQANPGYDALTSPIVMQTGVWTHLISDRNLAGNLWRWIINGAVSSAKAPFYPAGSASAGIAFIGDGYVQPWLGDIDEVVLGNGPITGIEGAALYERGVQGLEADATVDIQTAADKSDNALTVIKPGSWVLTAGGWGITNPAARASPELIPNIASAFSVEFLVIPRMMAPSADLCQGDLTITYDQVGRLEFKLAGLATLTQRPDSTVRLDPNRINHVAVTHLVGVGSSTVLAVNGKRVEADWTSGTGNEDPGFSGLSITLGGGLNDVLKAIRVSSVAKSATVLLDYAKGLRR